MPSFIAAFIGRLPEIFRKVFSLDRIYDIKKEVLIKSRRGGRMRGKNEI